MLDDADCAGARANLRTWWPTGFDPEVNGVRIEKSEAAYIAWPPKSPDT